MPIFLKTNTKNDDIARNTALQIAVRYDADVCYERCKEDGYWTIILKSSSLEVRMANIGEREEKRFLVEVNKRLGLFGGTVIFTKLNRYAFLSLSNISNVYSISNEWRMCLLFSIDNLNFNISPEKFAKEFHNLFFSQSEMHLIYGGTNLFEIRVRQKAFLNFEDAKEIHEMILTVLEKLDVKGVSLSKMVSSSDSVEQRDYGVNGSNIQLTIFYKTHHFDPIYLDETNKKEWLRDVGRANRIQISFSTDIYKSNNSKEITVIHSKFNFINNNHDRSLQQPLGVISWNNLQIVDFLGSGGYGDVYRAIWYGTHVAVKKLHLKALVKDLQDEFIREANMMAECQFPNIVGFYGICIDIGHTSLIMEYMSKGSLYDVLHDEQEELLWPARWNIAIDIGKGVQYLHSKNILHRDLKSLNVLLGDNYQAKLCDFGMARIKLESSTTTSGTPDNVGTVRWRAPETFNRKFKAAPSMDIYSYGMILWEIASRKFPFANGDTITVIYWITKGEKQDIPEDCPKTYGEMIQQCWLEANSRPEAKKIVEALEKAKLQPELLVQPLPPPVGMLQNFFKAAPVVQKELTCFEQVAVKAQSVTNQVNPQEVQTLLRWITDGHLVEVEKLLQKNPHLVYATGTITDRSDRTFNNMTGFQYAVWCLDIEMCEVFRRYLDNPNAALQIKAIEKEPQKYSQYGMHYDMSGLINNTKTYLDSNYDKWSTDKRRQYWQKEVGSEQRKCPAWLIYAWSEEGQGVAWAKQDFVNHKVVRRYDKNWLDWWFTQNYNNGMGVGSTWSCMRGSWLWRVLGSKDGLGIEEALGSGHIFPPTEGKSCIKHDRKNIQWFRGDHYESLEKLKVEVNQNLGNPTPEFLNPQQPAAFKQLFFTPPERETKYQARPYLFRFFSDRDRKSFGCVSKSCYAAQQEVEAFYESATRSCK